ncbi:hypothetical protein NHQ30_002190 [Ciborinia camelliae]|nr:hypothetical protein NHQ30_002190 [Ciborinia camelliae]
MSGNTVSMDENSRRSPEPRTNMHHHMSHDLMLITIASRRTLNDPAFSFTPLEVNIFQTVRVQVGHFLMGAGKYEGITTAGFLRNKIVII